MTGLKNLSVEDARARMLAAAAPLGGEEVVLAQARGRSLAAPITALRDQPPFDASAMDGWAVRQADAHAGARLGIAGESAAGKPFNRVLAAGEAVRIFTGAPVPPGADVVVIQEDAERDGDHLVLYEVGPSTHVRPRGGDLTAGETVLQAGDLMDPWRIALAASAGAAVLTVARRPRVAILANGEELVPPGADPAPWQIYESGSAGLAAMVAAWGGTPMHLAAAADDMDAIAGRLAKVEADLIVTVGGASVGDHDLVKPALARFGLSLEVETVAVRPGKPTWFGTLEDGRRILGLPGNPASAFVCAQLFLKPLILALLGRPAEPALRTAILSQDLPANGPREQWMRAGLTTDGEARTVIKPFAQQDSSLVGVFSRADALLLRKMGAPAAVAGSTAQFLPLDRMY
jgi:molybdopterin molybdotransferase